MLDLSWSFYQIQRNGPIPDNYPIDFVYPSMLNDLVLGGWFDAGDTLKISYPLGNTVSYLAWGLVDFEDVYEETGVKSKALETLKVAVDYLSKCQIAPRQYVAQIGEPGIDHSWWGRPSEYPAGNARNAYIFNETMKAADLLGAAASGLAAASMAYNSTNATYADALLTQAIDLYEWAKTVPGVHSDYYQWALTAYPSYNGWEDQLAWAAAWLYRATGNADYLDEAYGFWNRGSPEVYASWDSTYAPVASMLISLANQGETVPGISSYRSFYQYSMYPAWVEKRGWGIVETPMGLSYPDW